MLLVFKSQIDIRKSNIDQAKELIKKSMTCKSEILYVIKLFNLSNIKSLRFNLPIKPVNMT